MKPRSSWHRLVTLAALVFVAAQLVPQGATITDTRMAAVPAMIARTACYQYQAVYRGGAAGGPDGARLSHGTCRRNARALDRCECDRPERSCHLTGGP
jgi:hypothetical protein